MNMEYLLTAGEMKSCDKFTMENNDVTSLELMERAGASCVRTLVANDFDLSNVLIICGTGNNGGDGMVVARLLAGGCGKVTVNILGDMNKATPETKSQLAKLDGLGIDFSDKGVVGYSTVVDAIFGIGLSREITGKIKDTIQAVNDSGIPVLSIDVPSGVNADDGRILGAAIKAKVTLAIAYKKIGMLLYPAAEYCGKIETTDIGISTEAIGTPLHYTFTPLDLALLPKRNAYSNKGSYGKVLVIGGSKGMSGAAYFSAYAAMRAGCGLVKIFTPKENRVILQTQLPEAMLTVYDEEKFSTALLLSLKWASAVVLGVGLTTSECAREIVKFTLQKAEVPLIIDADALNVIAEDVSLLDECKAPYIVTPHLGEMARLTKKSIAEIQGNLIETAKDFAKEHSCICVLKDARTIVSNGRSVYINSSGNSALATGGSGDVLAGVITSLSAQGSSLLTAATVGVYAHGLAGESAAEKHGEYGVIARDIAAETENVVENLNKFIK